MADETAHIATAPDGSVGAQTPYYFCLEGLPAGPGLKPGRTWRLTDKSNSVTCICKSSIPAENELHVRIEVTDDQPIEHIFSRDYSADGLALKLKTSLIDGVTYTWGSGLQIPLVWRLGEKIECTSLENEPGSGGRLKLTAVFRQFVADKFPILGDAPGAKTDAIRIDATIDDLKSGNTLYTVFMYFQLGVGIIDVLGKRWTKRFRYRLQEYSNN